MLFVSYHFIVEPSTIEPGVVDGGTMIQHETLTNCDKSRLVDATGSQASGSRTIEEDLGTMVIIFFIFIMKYISFTL